MADYCPRCGAKLKVTKLAYLDNARVEECENCGWPRSSGGVGASPTMMMDTRREGRRGGIGTQWKTITTSGLVGLIVGLLVFIIPIDPVPKFFILVFFTIISFVSRSGLTSGVLFLITTQVFFAQPIGQYVLDKSGSGPVVNEAYLWLFKWAPCYVDNVFSNPYLNSVDKCDALIHQQQIIQTGCSECLIIPSQFFASLSGYNAVINIPLQLDSRATRPITNVWVDVSYWNNTNSSTTCGILGIGCKTDITKVSINYPPYVIIDSCYDSQHTCSISPGGGRTLVATIYNLSKPNYASDYQFNVSVYYDYSVNSNLNFTIHRGATVQAQVSSQLLSTSPKSIATSSDGPLALGLLTTQKDYYIGLDSTIFLEVYPTNFGAGTVYDMQPIPINQFYPVSSNSNYSALEFSKCEYGGNLVISSYDQNGNLVDQPLPSNSNPLFFSGIRDIPPSQTCAPYNSCKQLFDCQLTVPSQLSGVDPSVTYYLSGNVTYSYKLTRVHNFISPP